MTSLKRLLIVEDQQQDARFAAKTAQSISFSEVDALSSVQAARNYLEGGFEGREATPRRDRARSGLGIRERV